MIYAAEYAALIGKYVSKKDTVAGYPRHKICKNEKPLNSFAGKKKCD
ncbi:MAG: hypothetical protein WA139_04900 [Candidatus Aenigmatarchaeota archaeon]